MIRFSRHHQGSISRGLLGLLLSVWLSLAVAPCVMAMTAPGGHAGHHATDAAPGQAHCHACHDGCRDKKTCARAIDLPLATQASSISADETTFVLLPPLALPGLPVVQPPQRLSAWHPPDVPPLEQHPALKFRVLRI